MLIIIASAVPQKKSSEASEKEPAAKTAGSL
jgi:hypothetical protein